MEGDKMSESGSFCYLGGRHGCEVLSCFCFIPICCGKGRFAEEGMRSPGQVDNFSAIFIIVIHISCRNKFLAGGNDCQFAFKLFHWPY